jgi:uncharacterized protein (TIGR04562 family)
MEYHSDVTKSDHRIPVISDPSELNIPWRTLQTIIAGRSLIDVFELNFGNLDEAHEFLKSYGLENDEYAEKIRQSAFKYLDTVLLEKTSLCLPENLNDLKLSELMVEASADPKTRISEWSCLVLKICHAVAHAQWSIDTDAYNAALIKINKRLKPFIIESENGVWIGDENCRIPIVEYKVKTEKKFFRIVTKLLIKEGNLSARIYDHIGVRIVTHDIFSAILLIKFLRSRNIFNYANLLPRQSKNSIAEFHEIEELFSEFGEPMEHTLIGAGKRIGVDRKNPFSSKEFKMIKVVERILVTTSSGRHVFFPCEFQIITKPTYESLSKKQLDHAAYEKRQIEGVRKRLFKGTSLLAGQ